MHLFHFHLFDKRNFGSSYGKALGSIDKGSTVEIELDSENCLHLYIDGKEGEVDDVIRRFRFNSPCWAVFDVRGKCTSVCEHFRINHFVQLDIDRVHHGYTFKIKIKKLLLFYTYWKKNITFVFRSVIRGLHPLCKSVHFS